MLQLADSLEKSQESGRRVIPRSYESLITELRESTDSQDNERINRVIEELVEKVSNIPEEVEPFLWRFAMQKKMVRDHPIIFGSVVIGYLAFVVLVLVGSIAK